MCFDITQWTDYVRGVEVSERAEMARHLESGCARCRGLVATLEGVVAATRADAGLAVPLAAVRRARAVFATARPESWLKRRRLLGVLRLDEALEPAFGLRSGEGAARHLVYQAGDYEIDLRVERTRGSRRLAVVGQISRLSQPGEVLNLVPVVMRRGTTVVGSAQANHLGEFQLRCEVDGPLTLSVPTAENDRRIDLQLSTLLLEADPDETARFPRRPGN